MFTKACEYGIRACLIVAQYSLNETRISLKEIAQGKKAQHKAGLYALCFFAGFALCFSLLGASSGFIGKFLAGNIKTFNIIAGVLLIILGASLLDLIKMPLLLQLLEVSLL